MTGRTLTGKEFVAENPVGLPLVSRFLTMTGWSFRGNRHR